MVGRLAAFDITIQQPDRGHTLEDSHGDNFWNVGIPIMWKIVSQRAIILGKKVTKKTCNAIHIAQHNTLKLSAYTELEASGKIRHNFYTNLKNW